MTLKDVKPFLDASQEFADFIAEDDLEAQRAAVEQIKPIHDWRKTEAGVKAELSKLDPSASDYGKMGVLRRWLTDHEGEELHDEEAGLVAYLQSGGATETYDHPAVIKAADEALYRTLEALGCFVLDPAMVKEAIKRKDFAASDIERYRHRVDRTPSLKVAEAR